MNYNGISREEYVRLFGAENAHKYKPIARSPTFVLTDTINNKAQIALTSTPYETAQARQRTRKRLQKQQQNSFIEVKEVVPVVQKPEPAAVINHLATTIALLKELKTYITQNSSNFSSILNLHSLSSYNKFTNVCDAVCFSINNNHDALLKDVDSLKTKENILMVNAVVPENFETVSFNQQAYKNGLISNCILNECYDTLPSELPYRLNTASIDTITRVNNFMIIKNYSNFNTKARFLLSAKNLQYDLLIIEPYYNKGHYFTASDIEFMKYKKGNKLNRRLVYAYLNLAHINPESKFYNENLVVDGTVQYWSDEWKHMMYGQGEGSMIDYILKTGYDGIFVDNIKE